MAGGKADKEGSCANEKAIRLEMWGRPRGRVGSPVSVSRCIKAGRSNKRGIANAKGYYTTARIESLSRSRRALLGEAHANLTSPQAHATLAQGIEASLLGSFSHPSVDDSTKEVVLYLVDRLLITSVVVSPSVEHREVLALLVGLRIDHIKSVHRPSLRKAKTTRPRILKVILRSLSEAELERNVLVVFILVEVERIALLIVIEMTAAAEEIVSLTSDAGVVLEDVAKLSPN